MFSLVCTTLVQTVNLMKLCMQFVTYKTRAHKKPIRNFAIIASLELFLLQNTQEIKRTFFNWTKQDKTGKFSRRPVFQATYNIKAEKQTIDSIFLCQLDVVGWRKEKGTRQTDVRALGGKIKLMSLFFDQ